VRIGRGDQSTQRTHLPQCCTLQNPHDLVSNPGRRGGKPTTNKESPFCFCLFIHLPISSRAGIARSVQGLGGSRSRGSIPGEGKRFFFWPFVQTGLPSLRKNWYRVLFPNRQRREADNSLPSSAEVKNGGATPPYLVMGWRLINQALGFYLWFMTCSCT
jgi:hypothetical protein